ncbi:hypothetical protein BG005_006539 [Podila minutissima]|nr:hypothetical protein BG005_006539 [Podila minutissima]
MVEFYVDSVQGVFTHKATSWRLYDGKQLYEFGGHPYSVTQVAFSVDGKVRTWKSETGEFGCELEGPDEGIIVLVGTTDSSIWIWAVSSGAFMNVFNSHSDPVTSGMFMDGKKIVTVSEDCSLIVWDPKSAAATFRITSEDARFHSDIQGSFENHIDAVKTIGFSDHLNLGCDRLTRRPPQHLGRADDAAVHVMRAQGAYYQAGLGTRTSPGSPRAP